MVRAPPGGPALRQVAAARSPRALASIALAIGGALALWFGIWPLAAAAVAGSFALRPSALVPVTDAIALAGLVGQVEPVWIGLAVLATLVARANDYVVAAILVLSAAVATVTRFDWTILTALVAIISTLRALPRLRRSGRPTLATSGGTRDGPA